VDTIAAEPSLSPLFSEVFGRRVLLSEGHAARLKGKNLRSTPRTPQNTVGQMPHLGVATLTGVAPDSVWQADYLLKGLEHLRADGTVAPAAADHTVGAALKLIDSAIRTDYGVDIRRYIGQLLH
jgi:hypothetical protein